MLRCKPHRDAGKPPEFLQVARDPILDLPAERAIDWDSHEREHRPGVWRRHGNHLAPGVYCRHCLAEGVPAPLDYDERDLTDEGLASKPLIFEDAAGFQVGNIWASLQERFGDSIVDYRDSHPVPSRTAPTPSRLAPEVKAALQRKYGPDSRLYSHQAKAIEFALDGKDVVVETATASGKSLTYTVPILHAIIQDATATALYISPLNALSEDQLDGLTAYDESGTDWERLAGSDPQVAFMRRVRLSGRRITIARYDGNVDAAYRQPIRDAVPNILITNPEMLHLGILSHATTEWGAFFSRLRYVVIDEMHVYRGIFGSNFANLMRRLRRICHYAGANPQFISCSATIRNPVDLATAITGRRPEHVGSADDGAPRRLRRFVLWDAAQTDDSINTVAKNLMTDLVGSHRTKSIAFMRSIPSVRALYQYTREELREKLETDEVFVQEFYRALLPGEKRQITRRLKDGRLQGVVATTALQLGIDIGDLSAALIVKYPGSMAAVWQQAGRVGRKGEGLVFLLLDQDPLNQFFARHPDEFFSLGSEEVYVDPDNGYILLDHLWCAVKEHPLDPQTDALFWGEQIQTQIQTLAGMQRIRLDPARYVFVLQDPESFPASAVSMRAVGFEFPVYHGKEEILRDDASRAPRGLHKHARFMVHDDVYEVTEFELDVANRQGYAKVRKVSNSDFVTAATVRTDTAIISTERTDQVMTLAASFGQISLTTEVRGYYRVPLSVRRAKEKPQFQALGAAAPPVRTYETSAFWCELPQSVYQGRDPSDLAAGLRSLQKALALATCVDLKADLADVAGVEQSRGPNGVPVVFVYDTAPGGSGLAARAYGRLPEVLRIAHTILQDCPYCSVHPESRGCPRCVSEEWGGEETIDRRVALEMLDAILSE